MRSTYEDRQGTLWVCTVAGLDAFDRHTEKVTDRIRLNVPEALVVKALEDHAGVLWIVYLSGNGLASWDRHTRRLTLYSFGEGEPPGTALSGAQGIHEDADGNLWLATRGSRTSGLVKIDSSRKHAVRYRHVDFRSGEPQRRHADVGVRGPGGEHLGGHGNNRSRPVSEKAAAVQALPE